MKYPLRLPFFFVVIFGLALLIAAGGAARAETTFANEFWISTNTNTLNLGTLDNPYDGSTQAKFDTAMAGMPANTTIHIIAGTYSSSFDAVWTLKSGQNIVGSGMDITIIRATTNAFFGFWAQSNTNVTVSDLTVDMNNVSGGDGVTLTGGGNTARRVKAINISGWGIGLFGYATNSDSLSNLVEECEVSSMKGTSSVGIYNYSWQSPSISCRILDNRVFLPATNNGMDGIYLEGGKGSLVSGNYISGGGWNSIALYGYTDIIISHNEIFNGNNGVHAFGYGNQNLTIAYNQFQMSNNTNVSTTGVAFDDTGITGYTNTSIIGNTFTLNTTPGAAPFSILIVTGTGVIIANNTIDTNLPVMTAGYGMTSANARVYNNFDLLGRLLTGINQTQPANGRTRTKVASNYGANYADHYIGASTAGITVTLPLAGGYSGKELIIADESGNAGSTPITISRSGSDTVNGGTSVSVSTAYGSKTLISDGTSWFAH